MRLSAERREKIDRGFKIAVLAAQCIACLVVLVLFNLWEIAGHPPVSLFGNRLWFLILFQTFAVAGFAAPLGMLRQRAWGYYVEVPVVLGAWTWFLFSPLRAGTPGVLMGSMLLIFATWELIETGKALSKGRAKPDAVTALEERILT